jgi:hypothetical protein
LIVRVQVDAIDIGVSGVLGAAVFLFWYAFLWPISLFASPAWYRDHLRTLKTAFLVGGLRTFTLCLAIAAVAALLQTYETFRKLRRKSEITAFYHAVMLQTLKGVAEENAKEPGKSGQGQ